MAVITSTANPAVKAARKLIRRHGRARAGDLFLVEGPQAVAEAGPFLRQLFITAAAAESQQDLVARVRSTGSELLVVADDILEAIAPTVTTQGLVGVAALPAHSLEDVIAGARWIVVLHQVRDPGNAGTAIRTADAAGADAVILTSGSVDPLNPKAVRSSVGSIFHLPVVGDVPFEAVASACQREGLKVVAAAGGGKVAHTEADLSDRVAVVFGNEAHGLPPNVLSASDHVVRIPLWSDVRPGFTGTAESLNMAATVAVLAFECVRQREAATSRIQQTSPSAR